VLALAVAAGHSGCFAGYCVFPGGYAVQMFFVISGFLVTLILHEKYSDNGLFWSNRALRIYVPYLFVWILALAATWPLTLMLGGTPGYASGFLFSLQHSNLTTIMYTVFTNLMILGQDIGLWLRLDGGALSFSDTAIITGGSAAGVQVIAPGWSMALELTFYAIAPFIVRRRIVVIVGLIALSFAARFAVYRLGYDVEPWTSRFFPFEVALFLMGALAYKFYAATKVLRTRYPRDCVAISTAVSIAAVGAVLWLHNDYRVAVYLWPFYGLVALAMPFLFVAGSHFSFDRRLGDMSYPIYLIHWPLGLALYPLISQTGLGLAWISVPATIALAALFVKHVDRPLERIRQARAAGSFGTTSYEKAK
jgi:peptidoglycan/LPS O-acetylase OafA/YrhL